MKKVIVFLVFCCFGMVAAQSKFDVANGLYQKNDFKGAAQLYESVLQSGEESAELHYNLGNCYYKLRKVGPAIFHFEKAHLMDPSDEAIENNLVFARKLSLDTIPHFPKVGFEKMVVQSTSIMHYDRWALLSILLGFAIVGCFAGYYLTKISSKKRTYFSVMVAAFLVWCISLFAGFYQRNYIHNQHPAIVFSDKLDLHTEPTSRSTTSLQLREGAKVYVLEKSGEWLKVRLTDDSLGWLQTNGVREFNP